VPHRGGYPPRRSHELPGSKTHTPRNPMLPAPQPMQFRLLKRCGQVNSVRCGGVVKSITRVP
jgi:hypothetical protein